MVERGRRFQSDQVEIANVDELAGVNPHVVMLLYRIRDGGSWHVMIAAGEWWEKGRCIDALMKGEVERVQARDMVFFGATARDLIGKDADGLLAENYALVSTVSSEIAALSGQCYVFHVVVSRYLFRTMDICFHVLKFYPEAAILLPGSAASVVEKGSASGSVVKENQTIVPATDTVAPLSTPPPPAAKETSQKELPGQDGDDEHGAFDGTLAQPTQQTKKVLVLLEKLVLLLF